MDVNIRSFNASIAQVVQWDDHETVNNWDPFKTLEDPRYKVKSSELLSLRAHKAFVEYAPIIPNAEVPERIFQALRFGPAVEFFKLDARSYRGANSANNQEKSGGDLQYGE